MRVFLSGHKGMVGSAIHSELSKNPEFEIIVKEKTDLDLRSDEKVRKFISKVKPDIVIIAAAKVGGIYANNKYPADFIYDNLQIQNNLIHYSHLADVQKILFLGSSCIYPKYSSQPIREEELLSGYLEPTNEPYALAKIAGVKMCESYNRQYGRDYRSLMPTNLYGPGDNFHPNDSHVLPALVYRFHEATNINQEQVSVWGSGKPKREFLHVNDFARAAAYILSIEKSDYELSVSPRLSHINIGTGSDISILGLASLIKKITGFQGELFFDRSKPDGTPRKLLDITRIKKLGWRPQIELEHGLESYYGWFLENRKKLRNGDLV